ncbi:hypothetical protein BO71DRAFT_253817 [Aspergillus ellipticus CBS 707.79]|uniref:Uncharacterized protein n=1 Tax=Aspergillus ellipticus CBS 707.79 TaxID=1448320 RepID=A0A319D7T3_9EURO|nr:hypothetical protein BO71DRAFT_253817 [Aspergillus ellipticus CBS 707.79]
MDSCPETRDERRADMGMIGHGMILYIHHRHHPQPGPAKRNDALLVLMGLTRGSVERTRRRDGSLRDWIGGGCKSRVALHVYSGFLGLVSAWDCFVNSPIRCFITIIIFSLLIPRPHPSCFFVCLHPHFLASKPLEGDGRRTDHQPTILSPRCLGLRRGLGGYWPRTF